MKEGEYHSSPLTNKASIRRIEIERGNKEIEWSEEGGKKNSNR